MTILFLVIVALIWTQYKVYQDQNYVKALIVVENKAEPENQMCYMTHRQVMKTLIIIVIVTMITFLQLFLIHIMELSQTILIINIMIAAILLLNVIPFIYIWRSPKITAFIKKNYFNICISVTNQKVHPYK